jgi:tetratricopeptide (TPR) repeat protein
MKRYWIWLAVSATLLVSSLSSADTQDPGKQTQILMEQGTEHFQKQEFDLAIGCFQKAVKLEPNSAVAYNMLGMAYRFKYNQTHNPNLQKQEIAAFQKAIEVNPDYWVALINLGSTYYYKGDKAKAAPLFRRALDLCPNHPERAELTRMILEGQSQP